MRDAATHLAGILFPGLGHLLRGERRAGLLFALPALLSIAATAAWYLADGGIGLLAFAVGPGALALIGTLNLFVAGWRGAAVAHLARRSETTRSQRIAIALAAALLIGAPHLVAGRAIAAADELLSGIFAGASPSPASGSTPSPGEEPSPSEEPLASPTPATGSPRPTPSGATTGESRGSGSGTLPNLGAAVPWTPPGATPWGDDGRFSILLLGSDAGRDRWSRRMDVMLYVEVDVATGKIAMVGIPRNKQYVPLPAVPARALYANGRYPRLLNEIYVEATSRQPNLWPGTGIVSGIGAVRSTVSELIKRPIDAVLVADLWGVIKVVDALGGIDVNVAADIYDPRYPDPVRGTIPLTIRKGLQHFDGRMALAYARIRHGTGGSDYGRMRRQRTFLLAIRNQIGAETILNAPNLVAAAKGFVWTDLPRESLPALVELFGRAKDASVKQLSLDPDSGYPSWFTTATINKARAAVAALLGGTPPPSIAPTPTPSATPSPTTAGGVPGAPRDLIVDVGGTSATVNWLAPDSGGSPESYEYEVDGSGAWVTADSGVVIGDLGAGSHTVSVRARNSYGAGTPATHTFSISP